MTNIKKNTVFLPKVRHMQLNYAFLLFWSIFGEIHIDLFFLVKKVTLRKEHFNTQKVCFSYIWNGENLSKIWICLTTDFEQTSKRVQILPKTFFLPKVSHIQLNYAFLLFWSILVEIHRELLVLVKKVTISERRTEIHRKLVFLNMCEKRVNLEKIWICLNSSFLSNQ